MKKLTFLLFLVLCSLNSIATDYTTWLTSARGFTEVTSASGLLAGDYYYAICSAENSGLIVGIGAYEGKPDWASDASLALRYKSADTDPVLNKENFFTIEKSESYIGLRNVVHSTDCFQTHNEAGYMYVNTGTDKNFDEWSQLTPTYQNGYWLFESGKYPLSGGHWSSGYLGPWHNTVVEGDAIALNRKNTDDDLAGRYRIFRITKADYEYLYNQLVITPKRELLLTASASNPVDATFLITNPSFEDGTTGWTLGERSSTNAEYGSREYDMTPGKDGLYTLNAFQWWAGDLYVKQIIDNIPNGTYTLSAYVASYDKRPVYLSANDKTEQTNGTGDVVGVPITVSTTVTDNKLIIRAECFTDWWSTSGINYDNRDRGFFKIDNLQLTCTSAEKTISCTALPLPNNLTTALQANQWYYLNIKPYGKYTLEGNLRNIGYTTSDYSLEEATTQAIKDNMGFYIPKVYFKASTSGCVLKVTPDMTVNTFTAATMNVDGLPEKVSFVTVNEGAPGSAGATNMGNWIKDQGYDIVSVQEDFNYHSQLTSPISSTYQIGAYGGSVTGLSNSTDGLCFFARTAAASFTGGTRTAFSSTASTDGNQYITKGFRYYVTTLATGEVIDVYITHMDAGANSSAISSRNKQLQQLANAIISNGNPNRPKLFLGDTNCRWTREELKTNFMDILSGTYDVSDVWVELERNNAYPNTTMETISEEVVDKVFYINPKGKNNYKLTPLSFTRDPDYADSNEYRLGDHRPVAVNFAISYEEEIDNTVAIPGDVNSDTDVTLSDVSALIKVLIGLSPINDACYVNDDNSVNISDLDALIQLLMNK